MSSGSGMNKFVGNPYPSPCPPETSDQEYAPDQTRDALFSNDVFWRLLGKYLNYGDLKECRLVSRNFNQKIVTETNFNGKSLLTLDSNRITRNEFGRTAEKWKNMKIVSFAMKFGGALEDLKWLYSLLSDVEELFVCGSGKFGMDRTVNFIPPLDKILEATTNLKKLWIDQLILRHTDINIYLPFSKKVMGTLENLKELELVALLDEPKMPSWVKVVSARRPPSFALTPMFVNWIKFFSGTLKTLQGLGTDGILPEDLMMNSEDTMKDLYSKIQNLLDIVEVNRPNLASLQLGDKLLWSTPGDEGLHCLFRKELPALKSLKIRCSQQEAPNAGQFLRQLPLLTDLDLTVLDEFPFQLLKVVAARSLQLRRLAVKTKSFDFEGGRAWRFLSGIENLEVFKLHTVPSRHTEESIDFLPDILASLPCSVRKVQFRLESALGQHPWQTGVFTPGSFSKLDPTILTELNISRCGGCVGDDVLEFICRNFRFLRVLNISDTDGKCTDYGFIGLPQRENVTPFSISNLLGLRSLTLRRCGCITNATLIHGIKFKELQYLDVMYNLNVGEEGIQAALAQNPSLEVLKAPRPPSRKLEELKKIHPRLKFLEQREILEGGYSDDSDEAENDDVYYLDFDHDDLEDFANIDVY